MGFETREQWEQRMKEQSADAVKPKPEAPFVGSSEGFTLGPDDAVRLPRVFESEQHADIARIADALEKLNDNMEKTHTALALIAAAVGHGLSDEARERLAKDIEESQ